MRIANPQNIFGDRLLNINDLSNPFKNVKKTLSTEYDVQCVVTAEELGVADMSLVQLTQANVNTTEGLVMMMPDMEIADDNLSATITLFTHEDDWQSYLRVLDGGIYECILTFYTRSTEGVAIREPQVMDSPVQGYPVIETSDAEIPMVNGNWYKIAQNVKPNSTITITPSNWQNRVSTCFIDTSVVIDIQGVHWLYGTPTLTTGKRQIIAFQQIDAETILANLAVVI